MVWYWVKGNSVEDTHLLRHNIDWSWIIFGLTSKPWPLNCAICRCSSCEGRKSSWEETLPGLVAIWVTQDCRHESRERERAGQKRKIVTNLCSLSAERSSFSFRAFVFFSYLQPSRTHRQHCPLPCPRAAAGRLPHTAPCTPPSAAVFDSRTLSMTLLLATSQRRPRTEQQNHTGPGFDKTQRENNIVLLKKKMLLD